MTLTAMIKMNGENVFFLTLGILFLGFMTQCSSVSDSGTKPPGVNTENFAPPAPISPLNLSTNQITSLELKWMKAEWANEYLIQVSETEDFTGKRSEVASLAAGPKQIFSESLSPSQNIFTEIDSLVTRPYLLVESLAENSTYYWRVLALSKDHSSEWSDVHAFSTGSADIEPVHTGLKSPSDDEKILAGEIKFEWDTVQDAEGYHYQLGNNSDFSETVVDTVLSSHVVVIDELPENEEYFWRVSPILKNKTGIWTDVRMFITTDEPPIQAVSLTSPAKGSGDQSRSATLRWEKVEDYESYQIQLSLSSDFSNIEIDTETESTSYRLPGLEYDETYYWRVRALEEGQSGNWSAVWNFTTLARGSGNNDNSTDIPEIILISPADESVNLSVQLTFTWEELKEADRYQIQIASDRDISRNVNTETVPGTSIDIGDLDYGQTYYWRVRGRSSGKSASWSDVWRFETEGSGIEKVILSSPDDDAADQPVKTELSWREVSGADRYQVQIAENSSFSTVTEDETRTQNSFTASKLDHEKNYYWRVRAFVNNRNGDWSDTRKFKIESLTIERVELLTPEDDAKDQPADLTLTWKDVSPADNYQVQISANGSFSNIKSDNTVSSASLKPSGLDNEQTYYWRVRARVKNVNGNWSQTRKFTTKKAETSSLGRVSLLTPADGADDQPSDLTLSWEKSGNANDYQIQIARNRSFSNIEEEEIVSETSYQATGLENARSYHWRVRARAGNQTGEWSDSRTFTTEAEEIGRVALLFPSNNEENLKLPVTFQWEELPGVSDYQFQISTSSSFSNTHHNSTISGLSLELSDLDNNLTYYWRVRGRIGSERGRWSNVRQFRTETAAETPPANPNAFVRVRNGNFEVDGEVYRFAGTNAYYLPNYEKLNSGVVNRAFDAFEEAGITVVRMWAFYDGYDCGYSRFDQTENVIQTSPGVYSEQALRDLDRVIAKGKERGIRFILPFINYWDELGGICQYNTWAGASNPSTNMNFFINNSDTQRWFKDYINMLLNRVNTVTGVAYKNEPAIFAWQIMNEGRNQGRNERVLRDWYREMAQYIKSIDSNHLLSTGEEGFDNGTPSQYSLNQYSNQYALRADEGTSYILNTSIPEIDFGSAHWYPSEFGFGTNVNQNMLNAQRAWISDHQKIAADLGKPFVLGEYGFPGYGDSRVETIYDELFKHAESVKLDGSLLWQFTADGTKCFEFGGNICYPEGRRDTNLYNMFRQHIQAMKNSN